MTALEKNIIQFNNGENSVYSNILTFLERKSQNSQNTADSYLRHYIDFFRTMRNKELKDLTENDLIFTHNEIETYQVSLRKKYKAGTVNATMSSLRSLYSRLSLQFNVNEKWFDVERYKEHDIESYDVIEFDEIQRMIELVKYTRKGKEKELLIKVAFATAFRLDSLLQMTWSDVQRGNGYWVLHCLGKGNKHDYKKISDNLYTELMEFKKKTNLDTIFSLSKKSINNMMGYVREHIDFGDRNIVFHSIKKASVTHVGQLTNFDLTAMQKQGNHSDINTTMRYVKDKSLDDMVTVDNEYQPDMSELYNISHELLLQVIEKADIATKIKLNKILKEIKN